MILKLAELGDSLVAKNLDMNDCYRTNTMKNTIVNPYVLMFSDFSFAGPLTASSSAAMPRNQSKESSANLQSMNSQAVTTS